MKGSRFHCQRQSDRLEALFSKCLKVITLSSTAKTLHIVMNMPHVIDYDLLRKLLSSLEPATHCTFEISGIPTSDIGALRVAYVMQALVEFSYDRALRGNPDLLAANIARQLEECFKHENANNPVGRVFLLHVPWLVLAGPDRRLNTLEANEAAMIKLASLITVWPDISESPYKTNLEFLRSRVKLVEWGFKPSLVDIIVRPK